MRRTGDLDLAEEVVQDALVEALEHWPGSGIPANPGAWLMLTARRKALDRARRNDRLAAKLQFLAAVDPPPAEPDDRLRLIFTCCHPALSRESQVALTLRAVAGLTTPEIARAFLVHESVVAQRIVRAKRKIVQAGIPYRVPAGGEMAGRLAEVLGVLYLMFNEGYLASSGDDVARPRLAEDAEWLCGLLVSLMPREPEPMGLLALMRLHRARLAARFTATGAIVLLREQDRTLWDRSLIASAVHMIEEAARLRRPGPYQLQAAIAAVHAEAATWESTDWMQIRALYDLLLGHLDTPVVRMNRSVATWHVLGSVAALAEIDPLAPVLEGYHLFHSTRAALLEDRGMRIEARAELRRAAALTANRGERELLERRLEG